MYFLLQLRLKLYVQSYRLGWTSDMTLVESNWPSLVESTLQITGFAFFGASLKIQCIYILFAVF